MLGGERMIKRYKAKKDIGFGLLLSIGPLVCWFLFLLHSNALFLFFALIITLFFWWIWSGTYYQIDEDHFMYQSGPLKKKIPIKNIVKIKKNVRSFYGMRPALRFKYMQIRYNAYDDVFIAPEDEATFIADLMNINPNIIID
jgi:hypothetical protein